LNKGWEIVREEIMFVVNFTFGASVLFREHNILFDLTVRSIALLYAT